MTRDGRRLMVACRAGMEAVGVHATLQAQAFPLFTPPPPCPHPTPSTHLCMHVCECGEEGDHHALDHVRLSHVPAPPAQLHVQVAWGEVEGRLVDGLKPRGVIATLPF